MASDAKSRLSQGPIPMTSLPKRVAYPPPVRRSAKVEEIPMGFERIDDLLDDGAPPFGSDISITG